MALEKTIFIVAYPDTEATDLMLLLNAHSQVGPKMIEMRRCQETTDKVTGKTLSAFEVWRAQVAGNERLKEAYRQRMRIPEIAWAGDKTAKNYVLNAVKAHRFSIDGFYEPRLLCNTPPIPEGDLGAWSPLDLTPIWTLIMSPAVRVVVVIDKDKARDSFPMECAKRGANIVTSRSVREYPLTTMEKVLDWYDLKKEDYVYYLGGKDQDRASNRILDVGVDTPEPSEIVDVPDKLLAKTNAAFTAAAQMQAAKAAEET